jgi:hypothetical protein
MSRKPPVRRDSAAGRFYEVHGVQLPSVTTILSAINKPALVPWAAKVEREAVTQAAADLYMQWAAQPVTRTPLPRSWYLTELLGKLGQVRAHEKVLATAGDLGSEAHKLIEWTMRSAIGAVAGPKPIVREQAQWAFSAFMDWASRVNLKPVLIEQTVYSTVHGYAGTMDVLARVNGVLTLVDFKTGKAIYPEARLQSVAYSVALMEMGYLAPAAAVIVRLPKVDGDPAFEVQVVPPVADLFPVFLAAKALWTWTQGNEAAYRRRRVA